MMSSSANDDYCSLPPHIALLPSAGMGHLTPFLRLAAMLSSRNCTVTLITAQPTVSTAESTHIAAFLAAHPAINRLDFQLLPYIPPDPTTDPFFAQFEAITSSVHLLRSLLSSLSPPLSAVISDVAIATTFCDLANNLSIPNYILCTTSAAFLSLMAYAPTLLSSQEFNSSHNKHIEIPGLAPYPISIIPPPFFLPNHPFTINLVKNARCFSKAKGVLLNSFRELEPETIAALDSGNVVPEFPPVLPVGPLQPYDIERQGNPIPWLDEQPADSVIYVSFGSRTAMSREQIWELADGLDKSGVRFFWVLKSTIVDKEDKEGLEELLGDSFIERTKEKGRVVKGWVKQGEILWHPAIGCFLSHCGWNSVTEVAARGVPVLAWPQHGDQKVNAGVVEKAGLGVWMRDWGWSGERLVKGEEIAEKIREVMRDEGLKERAGNVEKEARKAVESGGSSDKVLTELIQLSTPK